MLTLSVTCQTCKQIFYRDIFPIEGYTKPITKSAWCDHCGMYNLFTYACPDSKTTAVVDYLPALYTPQKLEEEITSRPKKRHGRG